MATLKNLNELETISANSAKILGSSPAGKVGYISDIFNSNGELNIDYVKPSELTSNVNSLKELIDGLQKSVTALESAKSEIEASVQDQSSKVESNTSTITTLTSDVDQAKEDIASILAINATHSSNIETINQTIDSLKSLSEQLVNIDALTQKVNDIASQIGNYNSNDILQIQTFLGSDIDSETLSERLANYATIAGLSDYASADEVHNLQGEVSGVKDEIGTISNDLAGKASTTEVENISQSVSSVQSEVDDLKVSVGSKLDSSALENVLEEKNLTEALTDLSERIKLLEEKQNELIEQNEQAIAAVNNYTAVVKDMISEEK